MMVIRHASTNTTNNSGIIHILKSAKPAVVPHVKKITMMYKPCEELSHKTFNY